MLLMAFSALAVVSDMLNVLVIHSPVDAISAVALKQAKKAIGGNQTTVVEPTTLKALKSAMLDCLIAPFDAKRWTIIVDADRIGKVTDLVPLLKGVGNTVVLVLKTEKYGNYRRILDSKEAEFLGSSLKSTSFSSLEPSDISFLKKEFDLSDTELPQRVITLLQKKYRFEPSAVYNLLDLIKNGEVVTKEKDVINLVGFGNNTLDSFLIYLLQIPSGGALHKRTVSIVYNRLENLTSKYSYSTLCAFIGSNLRTLLDVKQLQVRGILRRTSCIIPESYNEKAILRLKRFYPTIKQSISFTRISTCLRILDSSVKGVSSSEDDYSTRADETMKEVAILLWLNSYLAVLERERRKN